MYYHNCQNDEQIYHTENIAYGFIVSSTTCFEIIKLFYYPYNHKSDFKTKQKETRSKKSDSLSH